MKPVEKLRNTWKQQRPAFGLWITLEAPSITEIACALNIDWVVIDCEHGHLGYKEVLEHLRAARGSEMAVLVRVPDIGESSIKRALDLGAHGVLLPLVRSRDDLERGFRLARYPTRGARGVGGERAVAWGLNFEGYLKYADSGTLVIPLIETRGAAESIDSILSVGGLEALFFGPADLSADYGHLGAWEGPGISKLIHEIREKAAAKGLVSGVVATSAENAVDRRNEGFRMIGLGSDAGMMIRSLRASLKDLGVADPKHVWF